MEQAPSRSGFWTLSCRFRVEHFGDGRQGQEDQQRLLVRPAAVFVSARRACARWRGAPGPAPVAPVGDAATRELTVVNPLPGSSCALPPPPSSVVSALQTAAM